MFINDSYIDGTKTGLNVLLKVKLDFNVFKLFVCNKKCRNINVNPQITVIKYTTIIGEI